MTLKSKSSLRKQVKSLLKNSTTEIRLKKSREVSKNLLLLFKKLNLKKFPNYSSDGVIGGFAPMDDEVDWLLEAKELFGRLAFPGTDSKGDMNFLQADPGELVESNVFGVTIKSPPDDSILVMPELLLIPGLAFGLAGERLGRGKGYYDKYLESFNGLKIGICTDEQIMEEIPIESHDIKMDGLVSDKRILLFDS